MNKSISFVFLIVLITIIAGCDNSFNSPNEVQVNFNDLYSTFGKGSPYSEIQKENIYSTKYKDKLIKTSIRADKINKASLSSQYVVLEMRDQFSCIAKAFFSSEEKDKLLNKNIGSEITFVGKMTTYKFGFAKCITFEDSEII